MSEREIVFEPHPVTPERKAELVALGYTIVDAIYAPPGYKHPCPAAGKSKGGKRGQSGKDAPQGQPEGKAEGKAEGSAPQGDAPKGEGDAAPAAAGTEAAG